MESEKLLERKLSKAVASVGGWSIKLVPTHITGLPDRLCLFPGGRVCFVEVKTTGEKPRKIQVKIMGKLNDLGFVVAVVDSSEKIKAVIKSYE